MATWSITKFDSTEEVGQWVLPGHISQPEIEEILRRLVCRDLSEIEIINGSRRRNDELRNTFLDRVSRGGTYIDYGESPNYVATFNK